MPTPTTPVPVKKKPIHHAIAAFLDSIPTGWKIQPKSITQPGGRRILVLSADKPRTDQNRGATPSVWQKYAPPPEAPAKKPKYAAPLSDKQLKKKKQVFLRNDK